MMQCDEIPKRVTDYLENELTRADRRRFETHIAGCGSCNAHLQQMKLTIGLAGELHDEDVSPATMEELKAVFRTWKRRRKT